MIHPSRYITSLYQPTHMQPPMCLQYIVMALAARVSVEYKELAEPFYRRARHYIEADEMRVRISTASVNFVDQAADGRHE